jgi:hypothetical protein
VQRKAATNSNANVGEDKIHTQLPVQTAHAVRRCYKGTTEGTSWRINASQCKVSNEKGEFRFAVA